MKNKARKQLLGALDTRWERYQHLLQACSSKPTEMVVHDLRTSIRRVLALLSLVAAINDNKSRPLRRLKKHLKQQLDQFDELRDLTVARGLALQYSNRFPKLAGLGAWLAIEEQSEHDKRRNLLRQAAAAKRRFKKVRARIAHRKDNLQVALQDALTRTRAIFLTRLAVANPEAPATIHQARIALKRLRYIVEFIEPIEALPSAAELANLQTQLGDVQDLEVLALLFRRYTTQHPELDLPAFQAFLNAEQHKVATNALAAARRIV